MEQIFAATPENILTEKRVYGKGFGFNTNGINGTGPVYINKVKRRAERGQWYSLRTLGALIYMRGGVSYYNRIQFDSIDGEGAIANAVTRARGYCKYLKVILRDQDEFIVQGETPWTVYVKKGIKVHLNKATFNILLFAQVHALELTKPPKKEVLCKL